MDIHYSYKRNSEESHDQRQPGKQQFPILVVTGKSSKENPQKLTQLSSRSHPRHLVGKRTAQKDTIIDITSDSQVNSNFPYRWSPASLTFNNHFYLFLYLYITRRTINNNTPHLKSLKNQNRRAAFGNSTERTYCDTWRSLGCQTTPLKYRSKRKPPVEPRMPGTR